MIPILSLFFSSVSVSLQPFSFGPQEPSQTQLLFDSPLEGITG